MVPGFRFRAGASQVLTLLHGPAVSVCYVSSLLSWALSHWLAVIEDMGRFGVSYLEFLILFEQRAGQVVRRATSLRECRSSDHTIVGVQRLGGGSFCQCLSPIVGTSAQSPSCSKHSIQQARRRSPPHQSQHRREKAANPIGHPDTLSLLPA